MDLGDRIELVDFHEDEPGELVIIKKIVGHAVKQYTETIPDFERLTVTFTADGGIHNIQSRLQHARGELAATATDENKFFALDGCLKAIQQQLR